VSLSEDPIITKVLPRRIERPNVFQKIRPVQPLPVVDAEEQPSTNIVDKIHNAWIMLRLVPHLFTICKGVAMSNWKTTLTGVVKLIFLGLSLFGISTGNVTESLVLGACYGIVDIIQSYFTADKK
jgi:hypothetical protein